MKIRMRDAAGIALVLGLGLSISACGGGGGEDGGGSSGGGSTPGTGGGTPTPTPTLTLALGASSQTTAQSTTLSWSSTNADTCVASGAWSGSVSTSGSVTASKGTAGSYSYKLTCSGTGGNASKTAVLTVTDVVVTTPPTVALSFLPTDVKVNQSSTLTWSSVNATSCTASGQTDWSGSKTTGGSATLSKSLAGSYKYTLSCTGAGGTTAKDAYLTVNASTIPSSMTVSLVAGQIGGAGTIDGALAGARFNIPKNGVMDAVGNYYLVDTSGHVVRRVSSDGNVSTIAGQANLPGFADGAGNVAKFRSPEGIAISSSGVIYVADSANHCIRMISTGGVVSTLAGQCSVAGSVDGTGSAARFKSPAGLALDSSNNLYVLDRMNRVIRKVTPAGVVTVYAGAMGVSSPKDGTADIARLDSPGLGLVRASNGTLYFTDGNAIRAVDTSGTISAYAGAMNVAGSSDNAVATSARFTNPQGLAFDSSGNLYVADAGTSLIRKIASGGGAVTKVAGSAFSIGSADGTSSARFNQATGVIVNAGSLIVLDDYNHLIRGISSGGTVSTLSGLLEKSGYAEGTGATALFKGLDGIAVDSLGTLYVVDAGNYVIRKISGGATTVFAGTAGAGGTANGAPGTGRLGAPTDIAIRADGGFYFLDGNMVRAISSTGTISTYAGSTTNGSTNALTTSARFYGPKGIAVDSSGNVFVADTTNCKIRKIDTAGNVTTYAGSTPVSGLGSNCSMIDGTGTGASFRNPTSIAVASTGVVYVADVGTDGGSVIRKIATNGVVTTIAGQIDVSGRNNGTGTAAQFGKITGLATKADGTLVVVDGGTGTIRFVTSAGVVTTVIGGDGQVGERLGSTQPLPGSGNGIVVLGNTLYWTTDSVVLSAQ